MVNGRIGRNGASALWLVDQVVWHAPEVVLHLDMVAQAAQEIPLKANFAAPHHAQPMVLY